MLFELVFGKLIGRAYRTRTRTEPNKLTKQFGSFTALRSYHSNDMTTRNNQYHLPTKTEGYLLGKLLGKVKNIQLQDRRQF